MLFYTTVLNKIYINMYNVKNRMSVENALFDTIIRYTSVAYN